MVLYHFCALQGRRSLTDWKDSNYLPEFCSNVINLLLVLQDLLTISLKQQCGHTQAVGVEPFELRIKEVHSFFMEKIRLKQLVMFTCYLFFTLVM